MSNYYAVKCKCGHVGRNHCILVTFPVVAESGKDAALIARNIPRCKHHHKDCIREVIKISYEEFILIKKANDNDPYLKCDCIQKQKELDLSGRIINEDKPNFVKSKKEETNKRIYSGKIKIKHPKKYFRFNCSQTIAFEL